MQIPVSLKHYLEIGIYYCVGINRIVSNETHFLLRSEGTKSRETVLAWNSDFRQASCSSAKLFKPRRSIEWHSVKSCWPMIGKYDAILLWNAMK